MYSPSYPAQQPNGQQPASARQQRSGGNSVRARAESARSTAAFSGVHVTGTLITLGFQDAQWPEAQGAMGIDIAIVRADAGSTVASAMRDSLRRRGMDESLLAIASEADRDWRAAQRAVEEARANAIRQNREVGRLKRLGDEEATRAQIQIAHEAGQNEAALRPRVHRAKAVAVAAMRALPNLRTQECRMV